MRSRLKRARRPRRPSKPSAESGGSFLMTFVSGPTDEPCDCPICRIMGIDLTEVDGVDVRTISPEQAALLEAYLEEER